MDRSASGRAYDKFTYYTLLEAEKWRGVGEVLDRVREERLSTRGKKKTKQGN